MSCIHLYQFKNAITGFKYSLMISFFLVVIPLDLSASDKNDPWTTIAPGLAVGTFNSPLIPYRTTQITILKINPDLYDFILLSAKGTQHGNLPVDEWCAKYNLLAAINAGMYREDYLTHVGYMKSYKTIYTPSVCNYLSIAAFHPKRATSPGFQLFDLDVVSLDSIKNEYHTVIQNLRLIKKPGENRWPQQKKKWSELALAQDNKGNILFIITESSYSMHDFNNALLQLKIGIISAQHLEGGTEASLFLSFNNHTIRKNGSYTSRSQTSDSQVYFHSLPNIIGLRKKKN